MSLAGEVGVAGEEDSVWVYVGLLAGIAEAGVVVVEVKAVIVEKKVAETAELGVAGKEDSVGVLAGIPKAGGVVAGSKSSNGREKKSSRNSRSRSSKNPSREENSVWI